MKQVPSQAPFQSRGQDLAILTRRFRDMPYIQMRASKIVVMAT